MYYSKTIENLSLNQSIDCIIKIINSEYFGNYEIQDDKNRIKSDIVKMSSISGKSENSPLKPYTTKDLAPLITNTLNFIKNKGVLYELVIALHPSEEKLRAMQFEDRLIENDFRLPLFLTILKNSKTNDHFFNINNPGLKESSFESEDLDYLDAKKKITLFYREITYNLKNVLPKYSDQITNRSLGDIVLRE